MSAFNWIETTIDCPVCENSSVVKIQTHMCSSYDGDDSGRFHDRIYHLGDKMAWWPISHPGYLDWREGNLIKALGDPNQDIECCYSECLSCHSELYVVMKFELCRIVDIVASGSIKQWPRDFLK